MAADAGMLAIDTNVLLPAAEMMNHDHARAAGFRQMREADEVWNPLGKR